MYHRPFTAKVKCNSTPLSPSFTQHMWELLAGNCMAVLLWHAQGQQISIYAALCASKSNKTNCKQGTHTHTKGQTAVHGHHCPGIWLCACVVVQFYPWIKFSFLLFLGMVMYDNNMIMSLKQKKRKFEPRIKLNHNTCMRYWPGHGLVYFGLVYYTWRY